MRGRILETLEASSVTDTDELMDSIRGSTNPEATALLKEWLELPLPDASALAGVLLAPPSIIILTTTTGIIVTFLKSGRYYNFDNNKRRQFVLLSYY